LDVSGELQERLIRSDDARVNLAAVVLLPGVVTLKGGVAGWSNVFAMDFVLREPPPMERQLYEFGVSEGNIERPVNSFNDVTQTGLGWVK